MCVCVGSEPAVATGQGGAAGAGGVFAEGARGQPDQLLQADCHHGGSGQGLPTEGPADEGHLRGTQAGQGGALHQGGGTTPPPRPVPGEPLTYPENN